MVSVEALKCIKVAVQEVLEDGKLRSPRVCRKRACPLYQSSTVSEIHETLRIELYEPSRHPCIISSFPFMLDVMKMTSAPKLFQVSLRSCIVSGRPPRSLVSHSIIRSGSMLSWMSREIVDPNVFSWSEPIQMRNLERTINHRSAGWKCGYTYQFLLWMHVDRAAPMPVPVQTRIPLLNMAEACPIPATHCQYS